MTSLFSDRADIYKPVVESSLFESVFKCSSKHMFIQIPLSSVGSGSFSCVPYAACGDRIWISQMIVILLLDIRPGLSYHHFSLKGELITDLTGMLIGVVVMHMLMCLIFSAC